MATAVQNLTLTDVSGAAALTGTGASSANYVLSTGKWGPSQTLGTTGGVVTWSIVPGGTAIDDSIRDPGDPTSVPYATFNSFETQLRAAFAAWSAVSNISFIQVADGGAALGVGTYADIRIAIVPIDGSDGILAGAVNPISLPIGGDILFDQNDANFFNASPQNLLTVATHEIGHAIGLEHTSTPDSLMNEFFNPAISTLQADDIAGAQAIYGTSQAGAKVYNLPSGQTTLTLLNGVPNLTINGNNAGNQITGSAQSETINGGSGNDTIDGGGGADAMAGGDGNDLYIVDNTADTVTENFAGGIDLVQSSVSFTLSANVENLTFTNIILSGLTATGNALDNTFDARGSNHTLIGGAGNDTYFVWANSSTIVENVAEGIDTVILKSANQFTPYTLAANVENLTLGIQTNSSLIGNALANIITGGNYDDLINGGAGADTMIGGTGNDTYWLDDVGDTVIENVGEGTDRIYSAFSSSLGGNIEELWISGAGQTGTGNALDNKLGAAADGVILVGGTGNDSYFIDSGFGGITITEYAGEGIDSVETDSSYTLPDFVENLTIRRFDFVPSTATGNALDNTITLSRSGTAVGGLGDDTYIVGSGVTVIENPGEGIDTIIVSSFTLPDNVENITAAEQTAGSLTGNALDNIVRGNTLSNRLDGGAGADTLIGGQGDDIYFVDNSGDTVIENAGEGTDRINATISYSTVANVEELWLTGDGLTATGTSAANTLVSNAANNTLIGGAGNDLYILAALSSNTSIIEVDGEGTDTVQTFQNYVLAANVENAILGGTATTLTGNAINNTLTGNYSNNILDGDGGADIINAGAGSDTITGGTGNDTINAGEDDDSIIATHSDGNDTYTGGTGWDILDFTNVLGVVQIDQLNGITTGSAGNDILVDTFEQISGSNFNDVLSGGHGINCLDGNGGDDLFFGNGGDDLLRGGDGNDTIVCNLVNDGNDRWLGGDGFDTIDYSSLGGAVQVNQLAGTTSGAAGSDQLLDVFERIIGSNFADTLTGDGSANTLWGGGGNDTIQGGGGADSLQGGAGADVVSGGDGDDAIVATHSDGNDTYTGDNGWDILDFTSVAGVVQIDQLNGVVTGSAGNDILADTFEQISGSNFNDVLSGGHGINCLDGNGGDDLFFGNGGDDLLRGGDGNDTIMCNLVNDGDDRWLGGDGFDTIDYSLLGGAVQVNLAAGTTTGAAGNDTFLDVFERIIGSNLADTLTGDGSANTLWGGGGADTIQGNGGADTLLGGAGNDTFIFTTGDGADTIGDFMVGAGSDDVINLHAMAGFTSFAQVQAVASQVGANTVLTFGGGDSITLTNITAANLHQDDFIFV